MPMPSGPRLALVFVLVLPAVAWAGEEDNWKRLRAMPRERRILLSEKLQEFEALPQQEKTAVRALDHELSAQSAVNAANYHSVLDRYHRWLLTLSEEQRKTLESTPPDRRMALVSQFRASQRRAPDNRPTPLFLQLAGPSPIEMARRLQIWFHLTPAERAELEKSGAADAPRPIAELAKQKRFKLIGRLTRAQEDALMEKLESDPQTKGWVHAVLKKAEAQGKKGENSRAVQIQRQRLADHYHFILEPPPKVTTANLLLFESILPARLRASLDSWPPDEARRRLTILYRLIYPHPEEIPAHEAETKGAGKGAESNSAAKSASPKRPRAPAPGAPL